LIVKIIVKSKQSLNNFAAYNNSRLLAKAIAVIEDEIDVLNLYQDVLENEGYTVFVYNEPIEAINNIQQMPRIWTCNFRLSHAFDKRF